MTRSSSFSGDGAGASSGSASAIVAGTASGYHVLRIDGYSRTKSVLPNGKYIESRPFRVAGHTWAIKYYPNGDRPDIADYVSLFLLLKDPNVDHLMVQLVFSFIDEVEKQTPSYIRRTTEANKFKTDNCWGRRKFIKREDLERSAHLKDDCFTVRCDIIVAGEIRAEDTASFIVVPPPNSSQHFRDLLMGGQGADVEFLVAGEAFSAHRCVLAARSPVFKAQLFGGMREGTISEDCIQIDDIAPQVFKSLLHFIYTDSLPETEGQDMAGATMMQHLLEAADRYDMQRLKLICEDRLCRRIDVGTVATTLALAEQHHCQGLKEACFEFLMSSKTLEAVVTTDGFQHLVKSCPSALFEFMTKLASR
ncbi:hypothetical protein ACP70R_021243 [Stipagrostis hirtigluma subsp. patula]